LGHYGMGSKEAYLVVGGSPVLILVYFPRRRSFWRALPPD